MKKIALASLLLAAAGPLSQAIAAPAIAPLAVKIGGFDDGKPIPAKFAYCAPDGKGGKKDGGNINPAISWSAGPAGTQSYALIVVDPDVPASFELADQPGKVIPQNFARQNFYHWVLVDIPLGMSIISEGQDSNSIVKGGRTPGSTSYGVEGQNGYAMSGKDSGGSYDGPCPPWNDERLHHYHFIVYALDVPSLKLKGNFTGKEAEDAMNGHVLGKGEFVGTYTNNQRMIDK